MEINMPTDTKDLNPTITLEARVDIRAIATLAFYFIKKGTPLRTRSSILREAVEGYARKIVADGAKPIGDISDAYEFLRSQGFVQGSRRITKDFFAGLQDGALTEDMEEHAKRISDEIQEESQS